MLNYLIRRLLLLPLTLFCIILVNFVIINLAPGDPVTVGELSQQGTATRQQDRSFAFGSDDRYLQFREHFGLTLPILLNFWPFTSRESVREDLSRLLDRDRMSVKKYDALRIRMGDKARFVMPHLLEILSDPRENLPVRSMAARFFIRGGTRQAYLGGDLTAEQRAYNRKIAEDNKFLRRQGFLPGDPPEEMEKKVEELNVWYAENQEFYRFEPDFTEKIAMVFESRFFRYMGKVFTLDFGTLRNDTTRTVVSEVVKRFKYSLTLAVLPMVITFFLCQLFGFTMAYWHGRWQDWGFNVFFLILYSIPVFVAAPFLIEKVALNHTFPFTDVPIPISGFTSPETTYETLTSKERLFDVARHLFLPLLAIMYGSLAASSRLSRTAVLEVMRQDYVRTARAKGVATVPVLVKHVGRNAAITIVTSIAGSLGIVLGGSLIVETLFEINGFGKFFYDAVINRDYNVIMFSAIAGSMLSLLGYLTADIAYTLLDPRVTLE